MDVRSVMARRTVVAILGGLLVSGTMLTACSSSESVDDVEAAAADRTFCEQAQAFQTFQVEVAADLADATRAPDFLAVSIEQLGFLADKAADDVRPDVEEVIAGFERLDAALAAVDYRLADLLAVDYSDAEANAASERLDGFLAGECGLTAGRPDSAAPLPFTPQEQQVIIGERDVEADADSVLAEQLVAVLGLTPDDARCLIDALGDDAVPLLLGGETPTDETAATFSQAILDCGITPDDLE